MSNSCGGHILANRTFRIIIFMLVVVFWTGNLSSLNAQPVLKHLKTKKVYAGQNATFTLIGKGFSKITRLNSIIMGKFKVLVWDDGIPAQSDTQMNIKVKIPSLINPGSYLIIFKVSGEDFKNWEMKYQIGKTEKNPEIAILFNGQPIKNDRIPPIYFDSTTVGEPVSLKFTISNHGNAKLLLQDWKIDEGFSIKDLPPKSIDPDSNTFFDVQLNANVAGSYEARLEIENNDIDNDPFFINLTGTVIEPLKPDIVFFIDGRPLTPGEETFLDFGDTDLGDSTGITLKVRNIGNAPLSLTDIKFTDGFKTSRTFPIIVEPGDSTFITIELQADTLKSYDGLINFITNIEGRKEIIFQARGKGIKPQPIPIAGTSTVTTPPEISVDSAIVKKPKPAANEDTVKQVAISGNHQPTTEEPTQSLTIFLYVIIGITVIGGVAYLLKFLTNTGGAGNKNILLSAIQFKTTIDSGSQSIGQNKMIQSEFRFRLEPQYDFGKSELLVGKSNLIDKKKINVANPVLAKSDAKESNTDDLTLIEGIGPVISALLRSNGIFTFEQLSKTKTQVILEMLHRAKINVADPGTWPKQAKIASTSDWEKLDNLQKILKGGRIPGKSSSRLKV